MGAGFLRFNAIYVTFSCSHQVYQATNKKETLNWVGNENGDM